MTAAVGYAPGALDWILCLDAPELQLLHPKDEKSPKNSTVWTKAAVNNPTRSRKYEGRVFTAEAKKNPRKKSLCALYSDLQARGVQA